uniref:Reverse transcriptase domain-containing protein n=1 Tax=Gopherus agassizii TaxID=38772 RepID=A0A452ITV0_9SAUR
MKSDKTPEPDDFPAEFYKLLVDSLRGTFNAMLLGEELPQPMKDATVVLPKTGKHLTLCSSYRPISLLNHDIKILAKI